MDGPNVFEMTMYHRGVSQPKRTWIHAGSTSKARLQETKTAKICVWKRGWHTRYQAGHDRPFAGAHACRQVLFLFEDNVAILLPAIQWRLASSLVNLWVTVLLWENASVWHGKKAGRPFCCSSVGMSKNQLECRPGGSFSFCHVEKGLEKGELSGRGHLLC